MVTCLRSMLAGITHLDLRIAEQHHGLDSQCKHKAAQRLQTKAGRELAKKLRWDFYEQLIQYSI